MRAALFYHSVESDWNNGNAHFVRGVATELQARGHQVRVFEPADGWSRANLLKWQGPDALDGFREAYPTLRSTLYRLEGAVGAAAHPDPAVGKGATLDPAAAGGRVADSGVVPQAVGNLDGGEDRAQLDFAGPPGGVSSDLEAVLSEADLVLVHEWNDPALVRQIGTIRRAGGGFVLLFHDTHHRGVTDPEAMARFDLSGYDGVLAFGRVLRDLYLARGWAARAWTWHEGADTRRFVPPVVEGERAGLVWIGNWGDDERTSELAEFLLGPVHDLGLPATAYGVRYPEAGLAALAAAGIDYAGWLPNFAAPAVFARYAVTVHVPRRPYARALPGIPTIRVFEALACGIPLVSAPWDDAEHLFSPGDDYLVARDGEGMTAHLRALLADRDYAAALAAQGLATVLARHTCAHRVDELLAVYQEARGADATPQAIA